MGESRPAKDTTAASGENKVKSVPSEFRPAEVLPMSIVSFSGTAAVAPSSPRAIACSNQQGNRNPGQRIRPYSQRVDGDRVEMPLPENAFITERTLKELVDPAALNSSKLTNIYQNREDDFETPLLLEVCYIENDDLVKEQLLVEPLYMHERPRMCVSAKAVHTMHRAIAILCRKVDNTTLTLRSLRAAYYKELIHLREMLFQKHRRREEGTEFEPKEVVFFDQNRFLDTITIDLLHQKLEQATSSLQDEVDMQKAAAAELEERLETALNDKVAETPVETIRRLSQTIPAQELVQLLYAVAPAEVKAQWEAPLHMFLDAVRAIELDADSSGDGGLNFVTAFCPSETTHGAHARSNNDGGPIEAQFLAAQVTSVRQIRLSQGVGIR
eukprot:GHVT01066482.1.p1 GENE.GHVT01066482.1~~GHVT01066482.1.p1  ORF type:complete len:385 (-),score=54.49 GHVT01066482.1:1393-2547(-)